MSPRLLRAVGNLLVVAGILSLLWAVTVWRWQDPVTAIAHTLEQRELEQEFARLADAPSARPIATPTSPQERTRDLAEAAQAFRARLERGDAVARLRLPTIGVDEIVVNGTDSATLKRGPGRYLGSGVPGEGHLVYVAGHRTTYGAPFSRIDRLRKGDAVVVELPYATYEYRVTGHRIVEATELSVLESKGVEQLALQACHPRFFASHRWITYARPVAVTPAGGARQTLAAG
jgi:sortase A